MRRRFVVLAALILTACGGEPTDPGDPGDPNEPDVSAVVYAPQDTSLYVGRSYQARPTVVTTSGDVFPGDHVEYVSLDPAVSVNAAGEVTGQAIGRGRVVAIRGELRDTGWVSVVPGGTIAFNWYRTTGSFLAVAGLDGSISWTAPGSSDQMTWLADGRVVAQRQDPQLPPLLYVASPNGTVRTFFPWSPGDEPPAQESPRATRDGQWVYFTSEGNVWRVRADGTGRERLTDTEYPVMDENPEPSPDGTRVLFVRNDWSGAPSTTKRIILDLATGAEQEITGLGGYTLRWSPDGQWIAYGKGFDGNDRESIYVARPDGTEERRVNPEGTRDYGTNVDWSPDGAWLLVLHLGRLELVDVATGMGLALAWATGSATWKP